MEFELQLLQGIWVRLGGESLNILGQSSDLNHVLIFQSGSDILGRCQTVKNALKLTEWSCFISSRHLARRLCLLHELIDVLFGSSSLITVGLL